jgi:hypothetical protein
MKVFETVAHDGVIRLPGDVPSSAHCVVTVLDDGLDELQEQARREIPVAKQRRMADLLDRNREGALAPGELDELNALAEEFDAATLAKGRALAALAHFNGAS